MKLAQLPYKKSLLLLGMLCLFFGITQSQPVADPEHYLDSIKQELQAKWPDNRTINLVFHGHSVPSGYFATPNVRTLSSYPYLTLQRVKQQYPYAVVNCITTSIGGEQAEQGAARFTAEVLTHQPDVVFIDYALNDRSIGLERARVAWEQMIQEAHVYGTKVILLTPTPDLKEDILSPEADLTQHSQQIRRLAEQYGAGLVDSYAIFKKIAEKEPLEPYMAQNNHINARGHALVAEAIFEYFKKTQPEKSHQ